MIDYSKVPAQLQDVKRWTGTDCNSKIPILIGKKTKIYAKCNRSCDMVDFSTALDEVQRMPERFRGLSFLVGNDYTMIDIDGAVDLSGNISAVAKSILDRFSGRAYCERSMSKTGFHIICYAPGFDGIIKTKSVEVYSCRHFCACTGDVVGDYVEQMPDVSEDVQILFNWLINKREQAEEQRYKGVTVRAYPQEKRSDLSVSEILDKAMQSKSGDKFARLMGGDWSGFPSQSEADLSFANMLAWWFADRSQAEYVFSSCGLYRDDRRMDKVLTMAYSSCRGGFGR